MNGKTLIAAIGIIITLQLATFGWIVSVERRLTRLETLLSVDPVVVNATANAAAQVLRTAAEAAAKILRDAALEAATVKK